MKYLVTMLATTLILLLSAVTASAQTFQQCADVDQSGTVNIADYVRMIDAFIGGPALPTGRGDIDFRQNYNLGDLRYFSGYIFKGYPEGGCPPFSSYTPVNTTDSVFLPESFVPPGSGSLILPIVLSNDELISELLITSTFSATNCVATIDSVTFANWQVQVQFDMISGNNLTLIWSISGELQSLQPGVRSIAMLHISYSASTGGTVTLSPASFGPYRYIHEVYGQIQTGNYNTMSIGVPNVVVVPATQVPAMTVSTDSMFFVILSGSGDPAAQTFDVISDGAIFDWSATYPAWISLTPALGFSGATVSVQPLTAGLTPGTHTGTIVVSSTQAYNSPKDVKVVLKIQPQFPSFDANCDGTFNVSDIVVLILYIFGGPAPCDPCGL